MSTSDKAPYVNRYQPLEDPPDVRARRLADLEDREIERGWDCPWCADNPDGGVDVCPRCKERTNA